MAGARLLLPAREIYYCSWLTQVVLLRLAREVYCCGCCEWKRIKKKWTLLGCCGACCSSVVGLTGWVAGLLKRGKKKEKKTTLLLLWSRGRNFVAAVNGMMKLCWTGTVRETILVVLRGVVVAEEELLCFGWIGQRKGSICFIFFGIESEGSFWA